MSARTKRQRTEDAPTRSDLWISDGNVVLQAANMQFRVHWGVLGLHSSVFREMQEAREGAPQPAKQPSVDGCSIVELPDNAIDVESLLKALYLPTFISQKTLPLPVIGGLIRLGRKYAIKEIFDSALARLRSEYPTALEAYDKMPDGFESIELDPALEFDTIILADENNISTILPCAYYCALTVLSLTELFNGLKRRDGTVAHLPSRDLRRCVVGRENLLTKQFQQGFTFGWALKWQFDDCVDPAKCRRSRETFMAKTLDSATVKVFPLASTVGDLCKLCAPCTKHAQQAIVAGRLKMWQELPKIFDLPPWNRLDNDT
ncbi:hypothetical protein K438DRAFT_2007521 [Mycena galopus ATCC 62051]|nr:hypothetical protein K438DRAFT_2007521 [Mycena galopus ATCC 62051]